MLKIYDLYECHNEDEVNDFIEERKSIPTEHLPYCYKLNTVVEDNSSTGAFYLAEDNHCVWWFGPRNSNCIANGPYDYRWFCFRTEDGEYHKFDMTDIARSRAIKDKILNWIAKGYATDGPVLNLAQDEIEFMDI